MAEGATAEATGPQYFVGLDVGSKVVVASSSVKEPFSVSVNVNGLSNRDTPNVCAFDGKQRLMGEAAEGRVNGLPKAVLTHLITAMGKGSDVQERKDHYGWQWDLKVEDGEKPATIGPVTFGPDDADPLELAPAHALSMVLQEVIRYGQQDPTRPGTTDETPFEIAIAVPDHFNDQEMGSVKAALALLKLPNATTHLIRSSTALASAYVHKEGSNMATTPDAARHIAVVDVGYTHASVNVLSFTVGEEGKISAEVKACASKPNSGVFAILKHLFDQACKQIKAKHGADVPLASKRGYRLITALTKALKELSMLNDASVVLECFLPDDVDISLNFTRASLEESIAEILGELRTTLKEALTAAGSLELHSVEIVGGGCRIPCVQSCISQETGVATLRTGLDGSSCIGTGSAVWAAGKRPLPAVDLDAIPTVVDDEQLAKCREQEAYIAGIHDKEVGRLMKRNELEARIYEIRGWLSGGDRSLLHPAVVEPALDKLQLWFEDAEMEDTTHEQYAEKHQELETLLEAEAGEFMEKVRQDKLKKEEEMKKAAEEEAARRAELGMNFDKDDRVMKKEDRLRLAVNNKDEGNDMFKAQKYDDAVRRYKKALEHLRRPELVNNATPDEKSTMDATATSCHLNSAQCYLKAAALAEAEQGKNGGEPFYKKARTSCDEALELNPESIKALFRRATCYEKLGETDMARKDIHAGLKIAPEDGDLKKADARLEKLQVKEKEKAKAMYGKMFG
mmetsp:Transcript_57229/g.125384  ORF Transcript_57229/g.125384 Transcript_57229/m.125384 type:complete len:740 (+) Transcript_57229:39-2258(+)